jgi:hypothetical protein
MAEQRLAIEQPKQTLPNSRRAGALDSIDSNKPLAWQEEKANSAD